MLTVAKAIESVSAQFAAAPLFYGHGTDSAWDEAVCLVLTVTGHADDQSQLAEPVAAAEQARIAELAAMRLERRIPLPYLLGQVRYAGLEFAINSDVLVPRSPIGLWLLEHGDTWLDKPPRVIADLCTGCGCIGIVAALAFPDARLLLTDIDARALALARRNVARFGLQSRTLVVQADGVRALAGSRSIDLMLSNPPYVNAGDMTNLPPEYLHEPQHALAAGADGLDVIGPMLDGLDALLSPDGLFIGEVGHSASALAERYARLPLQWLAPQDGAEGLFAISAQALASA